MKVQITFKTPDAVNDSLYEAFNGKYGKSYSSIEDDFFNCGCDEPEFETLKAEYEKAKVEYDSLHKLLNKYVRYGECVTVEFDSQTNTAVVA